MWDSEPGFAFSEDIIVSFGRRIEAKVQPDGRVVIVAPDHRVGELVELILLPPKRLGRPALEILRGAGTRTGFKSVEDVDAYIKRERESWSN